MNLAGMGSSGIDNITQQMAASNQEGSHDYAGSGSNNYASTGQASTSNQYASGSGQTNLASTAGLISNIANM
jgi:hypothetical protein